MKFTERDCCWRDAEGETHTFPTGGELTAGRKRMDFAVLLRRTGFAVLLAVSTVFWHGCSTTGSDPVEILPPPAAPTRITPEPLVAPPAAPVPRRIVPEPVVVPSAAAVIPAAGEGENLRYGVPSSADLVLNRKGFALGYSTRYRQALWVSYLLRASNLAAPQMKRSARFYSDPALKNPVRPQDYNRTGFDRGHLAPAADMGYSKEAMLHSFYMSNISPQRPAFNRGIWKHLEEQVREWARREKVICVVTGPIFDPPEATPMGKIRLPVPCAFYKVILDLTPPHKMIGFVMPNKGSDAPVAVFAVTVDEVERRTGCDFFSELPDELENRLESELDPAAWGLPAVR